MVSEPVYSTEGAESTGMYVGEAQAAKQREKTSGLWLMVQTAARHRGGYRQTVVLRFQEGLALGKLPR